MVRYFPNYFLGLQYPKFHICFSSPIFFSRTSQQYCQYVFFSATKQGVPYLFHAHAALVMNSFIVVKDTYAVVTCVTILEVVPNRYDIEVYIYFA